MRIGRSINARRSDQRGRPDRRCRHSRIRPHDVRRQRRKSTSKSSKASCASTAIVDVDGATVVVADLDAGDETELQALERI